MRDPSRLLCTEHPQEKERATAEAKEAEALAREAKRQTSEQLLEEVHLAADIYAKETLQVQLGLSALGVRWLFFSRQGPRDE